MTLFEQARHHMIESQVRPGGVIDLRVIAAMSEVPREIFVPEKMRSFAYVDEDLPIASDEKGARRFLVEPLALARMLQLAEIAPEDCALDIAPATGYSTAVLSKLAQSVIAVERDPALGERASANLERLDCVNAAVMQGEHAAGWPKEAPYDVILLAGRIEERPRALLEQLRDLGRLVCVFGPVHDSRIRVYTRRDGVISWIDHHSAEVPPLPGFNTSVEIAAF